MSADKICPSIKKLAPRGMNIKFHHQLNISLVTEMKAELEAALASNETVALDASNVESVDTAALQLLVAFIQQASLRGPRAEWHQPSEAFLATVKLMGLNDALNV